MRLAMCSLPPRQHVRPRLLLTLQVLEGQRHNAARSSGSHQALDVGRGQGQDESLLSSQVSTCIEGDEDGLVHAWSRSRHHTTHCVSQLLGHQERLGNTQNHREFYFGACSDRAEVWWSWTALKCPIMSSMSHFSLMQTKADHKLAVNKWCH